MFLGIEFLNIFAVYVIGERKLMMGFGIVTDVHIIDVQTVIHLMIKRKQK